MARARNIKPGFFKNEELAECSMAARLLFAGLWTLADREGRLEDRPKRIKTETLPYDEVDCDKLLDELCRKKFIVRYIVDDNKYIQILKFVEHQNPHSNESVSIIPSTALSTMEESPSNHLPEHSGLTTISLTTDSPISDSPIPHTELAPSAEVFEKFWDSYPTQRIGNRKKAAAAFREALKRATVNQILEGVSRYAISDEVAKGFAKGAAAWLNDDRWNSDYTKGNKNDARTGNPKSAVDAMFAGFSSAIDRNTI